MSPLRLIPFPATSSYIAVENARFTGYPVVVFPPYNDGSTGTGLTRFVEAVDEIKRLSVGREPALECLHVNNYAARASVPDTCKN